LLKLEKKIGADLQSSELSEKVDVGLTKFKNNKILQNKIRHQFRVATTKPHPIVCLSTQL
jgi:hypothetical protein